ncbi:MAG: tripartite tricarboxylate transporter substrate binding protein [Burkholderiales bacterium]|nr:tripartite tricarboxylate transporter substrate binding protein [Burkholderiales bacterium]
MKIPVLRATLAAAATAAIAAANPAGGQSFPTKPLRVIVPYPAGGPADTVARLFGQRLAASLGQPVVVDDRGGGGGIIAAEVAARSTADGHTLFLGAIQTHAINPWLYAKLPYDPIKDFVPIMPASFDPLMLAIHPSVAADSVQQLVALARSRPGKLLYASTGIGGSSQLGMELLKSMARIDLTHVAYKGAAPAFVDMLSGQTQVTFLGISGLMPHIKAGRLKGLAVSGAKRSAAAPEVPTVAESGFPGFEVVTWYGFMAPAGTPASVIRALNAELARIANLSEVKDRLAAAGAETVVMTPEAFAGFVKAELTKWGKVIREANIKAD